MSSEAHPLKPHFYQIYKFSVTYGYGCNFQTRHIVSTQCVSRVFALLANQQKRALMVCLSQTSEWFITTAITQNSVQKMAAQAAGYFLHKLSIAANRSTEAELLHSSTSYCPNADSGCERRTAEYGAVVEW